MKLRILIKASVMTAALLVMQPIKSFAQDVVPDGEIVTMGAGFGSEIPVPRLALGQANDYTQLLYDSLIGVAPDGALDPSRGIAEEWEMTDELTWTFHIRQGVKFHNGDDLTAKDVAFSIWQTAEPDSRSGYADYIREVVKSIDTPDDHTVVVHLNKPSIYLDRYFTGSLAMIIPKDYYEKVGYDEFAKHPIGSGPYQWHSQSAGSFLKLEAVENHWQIGVPRFQFMTFQIVPDEATRVAMLQTGEGDITEVSRFRVAELEGMGYRVMIKPGDTLLNVRGEVQWTAPAFQDIRFRQALDLAIDKQAILDGIFSGMGKVAVSYPGSIVDTCAAVPTLEPRPYDPEKARQLIEEAGLVGYTFTVPSMNRAGIPELTQVVEALAGYWQAIGLNPIIRNTTYEAYRSQKRNGQVENHMLVMDNSAAESCKSILHELAARFDSEYDSGANIRAEDYPELTAMFRTALETTDDAVVQEQVSKIYRALYDNWFSATIAELDLTVAVSDQVPDWDLGRAKTGNNYRGLVTRP